jgi:hypothetical protein
MVPSRRLALTTKVKSPLEGGLNVPRMVALSLLRETVDVISTRGWCHQRAQRFILGWGQPRHPSKFETVGVEAISVAEHPRPSRRQWLIGGGRIGGCLHKLFGVGRSSAHTGKENTQPSSPAINRHRTGKRSGLCHVKAIRGRWPAEPISSALPHLPGRPAGFRNRY